jgi:hypothetical protein
MSRGIKNDDFVGNHALLAYRNMLPDHKATVMSDRGTVADFQRRRIGIAIGKRD